MSQLSVNITGIKELNQAFAALPEITSRKAARPALRAGATIIKRQAVENVKSVVSDKATGFLAKNIVVRSARPQKKGDLRVAVAISGKAVNPKNNQRVGLYGSVLEFGKEGQPARPWLRPAVRVRAQDAINRMTEYLFSKLADCVDEARR